MNTVTLEMKPLVSIVIPTYNCERYIDETIGSVLAQSFQDFELIVVDDGSTDRTRELVAGYGDATRLIPQENRGVCAARNRGIGEARGDFLCLMDHDDYWFPDKLALQVEVMHRQPECGVVFAAFLRWQADATGSFPPVGGFDISSIPANLDPEYSGWIYHQFLLDCWMLTSTAMFRRKVFERCGAFDETLPYGEDWDLWLRIANEFPFAKIARPNTLYRQHARQGSRVMRGIDYRTMLLTDAVKQWGFCSRDGRCVDQGVFFRKLADYHAEYAYDHLRFGNRATAIRSYARAWMANPARPRFLAYLLAALLGWQPAQNQGRASVDG
jgi:glycosyltransferase involved in cell wall biosynthesis